MEPDPDYHKNLVGSSVVMCHLSVEFRETRLSSFCIILLKKQTI